jgi:hypothetical protein
MAPPFATGRRDGRPLESPNWGRPILTLLRNRLKKKSYLNGNYSRMTPRSERTITKTRQDESTKPNTEGDRKGHGLRGSRFHPPVLEFKDSRFVVLSLFRVFVIV